MKKALQLAPMASVHERFNIAAVDALRRLGYEVHLAANFNQSDHDIQYRARMESEGCITHQILFERASLRRNLKTIPQIKKLLQDTQFEIVHAHTETGGILTRFAMLGIRGSRFVYTPHGMSFYKGSSLKSQLIYRPIERWIASGMQANIAMNQEEFEVFQAWKPQTAKFSHGIGLDLQRIQSVDVDKAEKRTELGIPENAKLVLSIGELNENKNHHTVLDAIHQIDDESIYYLICGTGHTQEALMNQAVSYGMDKRFILAGYRRDIPEILKIADVFAFPSYHEGLPASVMEAMAAGLPVVCSEIRGNIDLITHGQGGYLCKPNDADAFGRCIQSVIGDSTMATAMSHYNLEKIMQFTRQCVTDELQEVYRKVTTI